MKFRNKAIKFIDGVISSSKYSMLILMIHLSKKIEEWRFEYRKLNRINIFDLSDSQYERKNYLEHLVNYGELVIRNNSR